ncbi:MAG: hypothetical protein E7283_01280 [Lachnospiraceae bacterium]|nr:hypothetical protein [Lachnospiraceae bacterium]
MIIEAILTAILALLEFVFSPIALPDLPAEIQAIIDEFVGIMLGSVDVLGIFLNWDVVCFLVPVVIAIANADKIWDLIIFILKKIPVLGIE